MAFNRYDSVTRAACLRMLGSGLVSAGEVALLAGVTRQLVDYWCRADALDWKTARQRKLAGQWRSAVQGSAGRSRKGTGKATLRASGVKAKATWDARHKP